MNGFAIIFVLVSAAALLLLPRRWAPLPLLAGACYMTLGQTIDVGPFTFTVIRILVAVGVVRVIVRGERPHAGLQGLDYLILAWAAWALFSSIFHNGIGDAFVFRMGLVYNCLGIYFLARVLCQSLDDVVSLVRMIAILLVPVAMEMLFEQFASRNLFSIFGGVPEVPAVRDGQIRAQGPFAHAILAGTVGATCAPLMIGLWRLHRREAMMGIGACVAIVLSCSSSGPIMSLVAAVGALFMWRFRARMRSFRWAAILAYLALDLSMKAPAYYLIGRVDLTGSSTGWHRARLIETSLAHLSEWWLGGTDYTRHWMPTGVTWNADHTDITNYYIKMGVIGGLPLMGLLIWMMGKGFGYVGYAIRDETRLSPEMRFLTWALGASLFGHAATSISISYFDQSFLFLYLTLGALGSTFAATRSAEERTDTLEGIEEGAGNGVGGYGGMDSGPAGNGLMGEAKKP